MRSTTRRSYIIRSWEEPVLDGNTAVSRFMLEIPATGARRGFTTIAPLLQALIKELEAEEKRPFTEKT